MAPQLGNYVLETATAPGTGSFTLNGPETDRRSFSAAFPNGGSVFYFADDGSSAEWGVGTLTIGTPSTLSRTTIIGTTSGGTSVLNFPGSVEVYNEIPAEYVPILEQDGSLTLAGSLQVQGKTLVQNVDDWTAYQAIGAKDADARYVRKAGGANDYPALSAGIQKSTGAPWFSYIAADGTTQWTFFQPAGDYATNPALNQGLSSKQPTGNYARTDAGNTFSGSQFAQAKYGSGNSYWGASWTSVLKGMSGGSSIGDYSFSMWPQIDEGSYTAGIISFNGFQGRRDFRFNEDGNIFTPLGTVALQSQLPLDPNKIILAWNGYVGGGDQSIPYPRGVSSVDTVIVSCSRQVAGGHAAAVINVQGWNNTSVQVRCAWFDGRGAADSDTNYRAILIGNK